MFPNEGVDEIKHDPKLAPTDGQEREAVIKFAKSVRVVIQSCNEFEYYASLELIKPPAELYKRAVRCDIDTMHTTVTLGKFSGCMAAIAWTHHEDSCMRDLRKVLGFFPNAKALIGLGVAFGMDRKAVHFCDVIVARQIVDYAERPKMVEGKLLHRGQILSTKKTLTNIFCKNTRDWEFRCTVTGECRPRAIIGQLVSIMNLLHDGKLHDGKIMQAIREQYPNAKGGEMEGWVLYTHVQEEFPSIETIVIKGVAGYADGKNDGRWLLSAAKAAASYAHFQLQRSGAFMDEFQEGEQSALSDKASL